MNFDESMLSDEMLQLANGNDHEGGADNHEVNGHPDEVVRTMEVPKWLSNTDVTSELLSSVIANFCPRVVSFVFKFCPKGRIRGCISCYHFIR